MEFCPAEIYVAAWRPTTRGFLVGDFFRQFDAAVLK
jgi:hypothetical protein